jgi:carbonic anhydrase
MRQLLGFAFLGLCPALLFGQERAHAAAHWAYTGEAGPQHWGDITPDYSACKAGKQQSPIDIEHPEKTNLPKLGFEYHPVPLKIINNGHTLQIDYAPGSFITLEGSKYQLVQFHFHHPSEEKIDGHGYDMVAHLVHKDSKGQLAVVAVLLKQGQANSLIQTLWNHLPKQVGKEETFANVRVNAEDLLPKDRDYYTYNGSLTTPPCTEGVRWLILSDPEAVSPAEINTFSKLYDNNARPTQPLNGRVVKEGT